MLRAAEDRVPGRRVRTVRGGGPAAAGGEDYAFAGPGGGGGGARRGDDAAAVGEEGDREGDAGVEVLAEEVVAVVEGACADLDCEVVGGWGGVGDCIEGEAGRGLLVGLGFKGQRAAQVEARGIRVVNLPWLALDLFHYKSSRHY